MSDEVALLTEDDRLLQLLAVKQFEILGLPVDVASSGAEAIEKASKRQYALIFMDLGLPQMDGLETTSRIREMELKTGVKRVPIIAMTAYSEREQAMLVGMDDFIQKPVLLSPLKYLICKWVPQLEFCKSATGQ